MKGTNLQVIRYVVDTCLGGNDALNLMNKKGETVMDTLVQRKEHFIPLLEGSGTEEALERCKNELMK